MREVNAALCHLKSSTFTAPARVFAKLPQCSTPTSAPRASQDSMLSLARSLTCFAHRPPRWQGTAARGRLQETSPFSSPPKWPPCPTTWCCVEHWMCAHATRQRGKRRLTWYQSLCQVGGTEGFRVCVCACRQVMCCVGPGGHEANAKSGVFLSLLDLAASLCSVQRAHAPFRPPSDNLRCPLLALLKNILGAHLIFSEGLGLLC